MKWETISSEAKFADPHLQVTAEMVKTPFHREPRKWTVVHRKPAVVIAAMTSASRFVLIRQERIPIRSAIWEMPAGQIDDVEPDEETMKAIARRELLEETGYEIDTEAELVPMGFYFTSPGFTDERCHFFLARGVRRCAAGSSFRDESEAILESREFSAEEISRMIAASEIRDANTLGMCARLAASGIISLKT